MRSNPARHLCTGRRQACCHPCGRARTRVTDQNPFTGAWTAQEHTPDIVPFLLTSAPIPTRIRPLSYYKAVQNVCQAHRSAFLHLDSSLALFPLRGNLATSCIPIRQFGAGRILVPSPERPNHASSRPCFTGPRRNRVCAGYWADTAMSPLRSASARRRSISLINVSKV